MILTLGNLKMFPNPKLVTNLSQVISHKGTPVESPYVSMYAGLAYRCLCRELAKTNKVPSHEQFTVSEPILECKEKMDYYEAKVGQVNLKYGSVSFDTEFDKNWVYVYIRIYKTTTASLIGFRIKESQDV